MKLKEQLSTLADNIKTYWRRPPEGKYMPFKEVAAYSVGGIGAYFIITLGTACLLATGNTLISSTLGVNPTDMYVLYVIAVLANIPLTGIRANIIDNTRNKAGKYRPYIVSMGIPTTIICVLMVWFPYDKFGALFGEGMLFGVTRAYFVKCTLILIFNLLLHFFYYFFYDSYENLIHVLSPNSQERADVAAIKSVVYSLAPTIVNLITPIIAQNVFHTNSTDIRVYRLLYPLIGIGGILLCILVYKNTQEKIVQARTHVIQIKFSDALREVAGNKYFWIISFAGWIASLRHRMQTFSIGFITTAAFAPVTYTDLLLPLRQRFALGYDLSSHVHQKMGQKIRACCHEYYEHHIHSYDASVYLSDERLHHLGYYGLPLPQCVYGFVCAYFKPCNSGRHS